MPELDQMQQAENYYMNLINQTKQMQVRIAELDAENIKLSQTVATQSAELKELDDFRGFAKKPPKKLTIDIENKVLLALIPLLVVKEVGKKGSPDAQHTEEGKKKALTWIHRYVEGALLYVFNSPARFEDMKARMGLSVLDVMDKAE